MLAFLAIVYVAIRLTIPALIALGIPFEIRALLLALLPYVGYRVGSRLFVSRE